MLKHYLKESILLGNKQFKNDMLNFCTKNENLIKSAISGNCIYSLKMGIKMGSFDFILSELMYSIL